MARKKDNKEAMFEALSRGVGSSMKLPDWAKPSSPQPFEHPEMLLEKPAKSKEDAKAEPQAVPEITIKLKAAASGIARKVKGLKEKIDEKRLAAVERKLAAIEQTRLREQEEAELRAEKEKLTAQKIEAIVAQEEAMAEEAAPPQEIAAEVPEAAQPVAEVQEEPLEPAYATELYEEVEEIEEIPAEPEMQTSAAEEKEDEEVPTSGLFTSLGAEELPGDEIEEVAEEIVEEESEPQPQPEMTGEEAGEIIDEIQITSVAQTAEPEPSTEEPAVAAKYTAEPAAHRTPVTATSIQQQVDLAEDNALLSQTLYARQVAMENSPEDSVHITLSLKAILGILGGAIGIICLVIMLGFMLSGNSKDKTWQDNSQQAQMQNQPDANAQQTTATETSNYDKPVIAEDHRDPNRYYIVIQQLMSSGMKDREEAFNIAGFCKERGLPADVVMLDGKKLVVWSRLGLKAPDDEAARQHALWVEKLGKDYFKISKTYDFRQRMRDGRLRPYYIKGKPYEKN